MIDKARTIRRWLAAALLVASAVALSVAAGAEDLRAPGIISAHPDGAETAIRFNIPAQPLGPALSAYSSVTGVSLFYNSRLAMGRQSHPVIGTFSAERALAILLSDTGLTPFQTAHNSLTLVLRAPDVAIAAGPQMPGPYMPLHTMFVLASPIDDHQFYAAAVRYSIRSALQRTNALRRHSYQIDVDVWVSPTGAIREAEILTPAGRTDLEQTIAHTIHGLAVGSPPPATLPQPVHVSILVGGRSS
jgi:hypothetical protein